MTAANRGSGAPASKSHSNEIQLRSEMLAGLEGDAGAHARLLRSVAPLLRGFFARRMKDNPSDIEDLVQESLIALHTRRESFDRSRAFTPWLFSIARHKLVDHFRRIARSQSVAALEEILVEEGFAASSNAAMDVERLLQILPVKQASAIRETKLHGLSVADAAARAGLSVSDIKISVHRGMKTLSASVREAAGPPAGNERLLAHPAL